MPKVNPEYFSQKKSSIVDAAIRVCERKTVSSITMQDVIDESGLSQGGIYRFYSGIDDILVDVLDRIRSELSLEEYLMNFSPEARSPQENAKVLFQMMADHIKSHRSSYKIQFEYYLLLTNYPKRAETIWNKVHFPNPYNLMNKMVYEYILKGISENKIKPIIPLDTYFKFMSSIFDGILKRSFSETGYVKNVLKNEDFCYDIDTLFHTAYLTSCHLLGINNDSSI